MLQKFERFNDAVSRVAEWIAFGAVVLMVFVTCADVLGTKIFLSPVPGGQDIMMMAQLVAVTFAAAMALIRGRHVAVEFFVMLFPKRAQAVIDCVAQILSLGLFVIIAWRFFTHGYHLQIGGELTPTAGFPMAPFSYAAGAATIPVCLVLLQEVFGSIMKVVGNEP